MKFPSIVLFSSVVAVASAHGAELKLTFAPIEQATGKIRIAVYDSKANFMKTAVRAVEIAAQLGGAEVRISDLPAGEYAVMAFQDLNGNNKLDTNLVGVPKEPWGGSLGDRSVFGAPGWDDTHFALPETGKAVNILLNH